MKLPPALAELQTADLPVTMFLCRGFFFMKIQLTTTTSKTLRQRFDETLGEWVDTDVDKLSAKEKGVIGRELAAYNVRSQDIASFLKVTVQMTSSFTKHR